MIQIDYWSVFVALAVHICLFSASDVYYNVSGFFRGEMLHMYVYFVLWYTVNQLDILSTRQGKGDRICGLNGW